MERDEEKIMQEKDGKNEEKIMQEKDGKRRRENECKRRMER